MVKKEKKLFSKKRAPYSEKFIWHFILVLWLAGIFLLSGVEGSGKPYFDLRMLLERKGAHILEYLVLTFLLWKTLGLYCLEVKARTALCISFALLWAAWDEVHQLFVFGREGKVLDIAIDAFGIFLFFVLYYLSKGKEINLTRQR